MDDREEVIIKGKLDQESIVKWLSVVKDGKQNGVRRSDLAMNAKRHLSALGWGFAYIRKGKGRELRYKSPKGKWFISLATACVSFVEEQQKQQEIVPKSDFSCSPRYLDVSNQKPDDKRRKKRYRFEDCDFAVSTPNKDNQQQKKNSERVRNCHTAAFKEETTREKKTPSSDFTEIVPNIDVSKQPQKQRRKTRTTAFNSSTLLQVTTEKNCNDPEKEEKESMRLWRKDCGPEMNYNVCCVCHLGGDLLLCDGCPSAFHYTCLGLSSLPHEELWFCPCCCCNICESMDSPVNSKLMNCKQCRRRFHLECSVEEPSGYSFCSSQCNKVCDSLQSLLGCKIAVGDGDLVWTLMRAPNEDEHYDDEQISKLNSAVKILHQGFEPTKDPLSGKDLVEELIFSRVRGFYTVFIESNNEPITVAVVRVDKHEAEIPLVVTLSNYRRSGKCRVLMTELEKQMSKIGVHKLVLPAASEIVTTWTEQFGFSVMETSERVEAVKHGMLDFAGTVMCHKFLKKRSENSAQSNDKMQKVYVRRRKKRPQGGERDETCSTMQVC